VSSLRLPTLTTIASCGRVIPWSGNRAFDILAQPIPSWPSSGPSTGSFSEADSVAQQFEGIARG
jgi:hypothetical protein